jgi:translocation and assembly module TamB
VDGRVNQLLSDPANAVTLSSIPSRSQGEIYPLVLPSSERNSSVLSLGGELGFDLTNRLTISASQVLTGQYTPTRFNVIYQLSDRVQARTAVSNQGEGIGVLEYRTNF